MLVLMLKCSYTVKFSRLDTKTTIVGTSYTKRFDLQLVLESKYEPRLISLHHLEDLPFHTKEACFEENKKTGTLPSLPLLTHSLAQPSTTAPSISGK